MHLWLICRTLKLASCMWTAPRTAFTDSEAVYHHQVLQLC